MLNSDALTVGEAGVSRIELLRAAFKSLCHYLMINGFMYVHSNAEYDI